MRQTTPGLCGGTHHEKTLVGFWGTWDFAAFWLVENSRKHAKIIISGTSALIDSGLGANQSWSRGLSSRLLNLEVSPMIVFQDGRQTFEFLPTTSCSVFSATAGPIDSRFKPYVAEIVGACFEKYVKGRGVFE